MSDSLNNQYLHYEIIIGPMYSGKTTELYRRIHRFKSIGEKVCVINHNYDTRSCGIKTHQGIEYPAVKIDSLMNFFESDYFKNTRIIGIDEAQFFTDLKEFILASEKYNKIIIVAGLDGTYLREPFGEILSTIPLCNKLDKLSALDMILKNGTAADFSKKISEDGDLISIGSTDKYLAVCRSEYLKQ